MIICLEYEGEREMPVSFCRLGLFRRIYRLRTSCVALPEHWCCPSHCHCKHRLKALTAPVIGKKSSHRHHFSCHILDRNGGHSSTWDVEVCARPHRQTVPLSPSRGNMSSKPMMAMPTIQGELSSYSRGSHRLLSTQAAPCPEKAFPRTTKPCSPQFSPGDLQRQRVRIERRWCRQGRQGQEMYNRKAKAERTMLGEGGHR